MGLLKFIRFGNIFNNSPTNHVRNAFFIFDFYVLGHMIWSPYLCESSHYQTEQSWTISVHCYKTAQQHSLIIVEINAIICENHLHSHLETIHNGGFKVNNQSYLLIFKPIVFRNAVLSKSQTIWFKSWV